jgi:hypothetical protein
MRRGSWLKQLPNIVNKSMVSSIVDMTTDSQLTGVNDNGELLYGYSHRWVKDFVSDENRMYTPWKIF